MAIINCFFSLLSENSFGIFSIVSHAKLNAKPRNYYSWDFSCKFLDNAKMQIMFKQRGG